MTGLFILLAVVLIIIVICLLRVGIILGYSQDGFEVIAKIAFFRITVYSGVQKKERAQKKDKKVTKHKDRSKGEEDKKEKSGFRALELSDYLTLICGALRRLGNASRIDLIRVHFVAASEDDPAKVAVMYGRAWAAEGIIVGVLENNIEVRKKDISIELDYAAEKPKISFLLQLTTRIGGILRAVIGFVRDYYLIRRKKSPKLYEKGGA